MSGEWPEDLVQSCRHVHWYAEPEEVLATPGLYLQHVMSNGGDSDVSVAERYFTKEDFISALQTAVPGKFMRKDWDLWHEKLGLEKAPLPQRYPDLSMPEGWWLASRNK